MLDAGTPLSLEALNLPLPSGCSLKPVIRVDRQAMDCVSKVELTMPGGWKRAGELLIWTLGDRSIAHSWTQSGDRWLLIRSVHQSKGDHASEVLSSGTESSRVPQ